MSARRELGRTEAAAKASAAEEKELKRSISNVIRAVDLIALCVLVLVRLRQLRWVHLALK